MGPGRARGAWPQLAREPHRQVQARPRCFPAVQVQVAVGSPGLPHAPAQWRGTAVPEALVSGPPCPSRHWAALRHLNQVPSTAGLRLGLAGTPLPALHSPGSPTNQSPWTGPLAAARAGHGVAAQEALSSRSRSSCVGVGSPPAELQLQPQVLGPGQLWAWRRSCGLCSGRGLAGGQAAATGPQRLLSSQALS